MNTRESRDYERDIYRVASATRAVPFWTLGQHGWQLLLFPRRRGIDITRIEWRKSSRPD